MPYIDPNFTEEEVDPNLDYFDEAAQEQSALKPVHAASAKRQASMVAVMEGANVVDTYTRVLSDLQNNGTSTDVERERILAENGLEEDQLAAAEQIIRDPSLSKPQVIKSLLALQSQRDQRGQV